jgi:hypothetical protein
MNKKELKFWHGGSPPQDNCYTKIQLAILFAISRKQPYTSVRDKYKFSLGEIYNNILTLRKYGNLTFNKDGILHVAKCRYSHIENNNYREIYDYAAKHIDTNLIRLDDCLTHYTDFSHRFLIKYAYRQTTENEFGRSALRAIPVPPDGSSNKDIAKTIIAIFKAEVDYINGAVERHKRYERECAEREERIRNPGLYVI